MSMEKMIQQWEREGTISKEQAKKMEADVHSQKKEARSNSFIVIISTFGAVLTGLGAVLFIASNWDKLGNAVKIAILVVATFGTHALGYWMTYYKRHLPRVGSALLFLSALLFGASVFLIGQMYNVRANSHWLVLIWLAGVVPLVYAYKTAANAALAVLVFYVWVGFCYIRPDSARDFSFALVPIIFFSASVFLFGIGGMHYLESSLHSVARTVRIMSLKIAMLTLFLFTFEALSGAEASDHITALSGFAPGIYAFIGIGIIAALYLLRRNPAKSATGRHENGLAIALSVLVLVFAHVTTDTQFFMYLFNVVFAGLVMFLIYIGIAKEDMGVVNTGIWWAVIFIVAKYFDFFWDLFPRSLFFMAGGLLLVGGGIVMERKRRKLKQEFSH